METKYAKKKKKIGLGLMKFAQIARVSLERALEFDDGWLHDDKADVMNDVEDECRERRQIISVRSKCLPATISLVFRICHTTAL